MQFVSLQNDHHAVDTCRMAWSAGVPIWRTCATQETWRETRLFYKFEMSPVDLGGFKRSGPVKQQEFCYSLIYFVQLLQKVVRLVAMYRGPPQVQSRCITIRMPDIESSIKLRFVATDKVLHRV